MKGKVEPEGKLKFSGTLEAVLQRKKEEFQDDAGRSKELRDEWVNRVKGLFEEIDSWLIPLKVKRYLGTTLRYFMLTEEPYGTYKVSSLVITFFNDRRMVLAPKGLNVIGAKGRVDIEMETKTVSLVLDADSGDWKVAERKGVGHETTPWSREVFEQLIEEFVENF